MTWERLWIPERQVSRDAAGGECAIEAHDVGWRVGAGGRNETDPCRAAAREPEDEVVEQRGLRFHGESASAHGHDVSVVLLNRQLPTANCQLSTDNCQLSTDNDQRHTPRASAPGVSEH